MLSDRPYMSNGYNREGTSVYIWLISVIGAAFVMELVLLSPWWPAGGRLVANLVLTEQALREWKLWSLLTHCLIHDSHSPFHILFVLFSLAYIGRELEPLLGSRRFLAVFVATVLGGGLGWFAVHLMHPGAFIHGGGAGVVGLFVVLACVYPDREMRLLFLPITFRAKQIVWGLLALDIFGLVLYEILGAAAPIDFSPSAHLGGMLVGWIYFRFFHASNGWDRRPGIELPAWLRRRPKARTEAADFKVNIGRPSSSFRAEVDRILDKINSQGFGSLTEEEKRVLDEAKDMLSRP
jgi:membrane associated rhomboid family serine protease